MQNGLYFTPESVLRYIKPGEIIEGATPDKNFLIEAYDAIMSNPAYGRGADATINM